MGEFVRCCGGGWEGRRAEGVRGKEKTIWAKGPLEPWMVRALFPRLNLSVLRCGRFGGGHKPVQSGLSLPATYFATAYDPYSQHS